MNNQEIRIKIPINIMIKKHINSKLTIKKNKIFGIFN